MTLTKIQTFSRTRLSVIICQTKTKTET